MRAKHLQQRKQRARLAKIVQKAYHKTEMHLLHSAINSVHRDDTSSQAPSVVVLDSGATSTFLRPQDGSQYG